METVIVTGFGPFGNYQINASWEAVKLLPGLGLDSLGVELVVEEVPVVYQNVADVTTALWKKTPKLVVHVGVSHMANELTLETIAHRNGYKKPDISGEMPVNGMCCLDGKPSYNTCIDLQEVCNQFNGTNVDTKATVSKDAGRFLCEYIFYCSMSFNEERTIFVHVPDIGKPYTVEQTALGLKNIILLCLDQVNRKCPSGLKA